MKHKTMIFFAAVLFLLQVPAGVAEEEREKKPSLTIEMLAPWLKISYYCYDIKPIIGTEKSLYFEVVTKDGVIFNRPITSINKFESAPQYLGVLVRNEGVNLHFTNLFIMNKSGLIKAMDEFETKDFMVGMPKSSFGSSGVFKLGDYFLYSSPNVKKSKHGIKIDELLGEIGYRIVAK